MQNERMLSSNHILAIISFVVGILIYFLLRADSYFLNVKWYSYLPILILLYFFLCSLSKIIVKGGNLTFLYPFRIAFREYQYPVSEIKHIIIKEGSNVAVIINYKN